MFAWTLMKFFAAERNPHLLANMTDY